MSKNTIKTYVLLAALGGFFILIGGAVFKGPGLVIGLFLGLAMVGGSYWFSDKLAVKAARAVPVTEAEAPALYRIVRELTTRANMPMPKLYVTPDLQPNAFATGRSPEHAAVACTQGIMQMLTEDELKGVLAHELSHVGNRDILIGSVAATIAMGITFVARMAMWGAMLGGGNRDRDGGNAIGQLALLILAPVAAMMLQMAFASFRLLHDGEPLARALEKIEAGARQIPMDVNPAQAQAYIINPLTGRKVSAARWFMTHPATEERVARLRQMHPGAARF